MIATAFCTASFFATTMLLTAAEFFAAAMLLTAVMTAISSDSS